MELIRTNPKIFQIFKFSFMINGKKISVPKRKEKDEC